MDALIDVDVARANTDELVHPELGTNTPTVIPFIDDPELGQAFEQAAHVVQDTVEMHRYVQVPMECRGIIADWNPHDQELTVWSSTQSVHEVRGFLAGLLGLGTNQIRVLQQDVGGGFGQKIMIMRDEWAVVLAATLLGRPVRWIEDRRENLVAAAHARDEKIDLSMAVDRDGIITAIRGEHIENIGAYQAMGSTGSGALVGPFLSNAYKIPKVGYASQAVYTNTCGKAPYRVPFLMYAVGIEQLMDTAARQIGIDPLDLRRRNVIRAEDLPYTLPSMLCFDAITPAETLEQAASMIDYDKFRAEQTVARDQGRYLGIGTSLCVEPSAIAFGELGTEAAVVRMDYTGKVTVALGSSSTGTSVTTTMKQVVAEHLGCAMEDVSIVQGDTAATPYGAGTAGSRSAVLYGNAVAAATIELRSKLLDIAAHALEAAVEDLAIENSRVFVRGTPVKGMDFAQLGELAYIGHDLLAPGTTPGLEASHRFKAPPFTFSNACHMCTCEVEVDTGRVTILRYVVSEDCGLMINPQSWRARSSAEWSRASVACCTRTWFTTTTATRWPAPSSTTLCRPPPRYPASTSDTSSRAPEIRWGSREWEKVARLRPPPPSSMPSPTRWPHSESRSQALRSGPSRSSTWLPRPATERQPERSSRDDLDQVFQCVQVVAVDKLVDVR